MSTVLYILIPSSKLSLKKTRVNLTSHPLPPIDSRLSRKMISLRTRKIFVMEMFTSMTTQPIFGTGQSFPIPSFAQSMESKDCLPSVPGKELLIPRLTIVSRTQSQTASKEGNTSPGNSKELSLESSRTWIFLRIHLLILCRPLKTSFTCLKLIRP